MTDTEFLQSEALKETRKKAYKRNRVFLSVLTFLGAGLAVACLIGLLAAVILLNIKEDNRTLYLILSGSFLGGAVLFALGAFGMEKLSYALTVKEFDFRERCDGEHSFFVGEGTLAVLNDDGLFIHSEEVSNKSEIRVPYSEVRFFSVCNRRRPKNKGEWSVVLEIPAHYLAKSGKVKRDEPPALVQADGKERFYKRLEELSLPLLGEAPVKNDGKPFTLCKKYKLPNRQKRKRAAFLLALGALLTMGGVFLGIFVNPTLSIVSALGLFVGGRALGSFLRAQATLGVYQEGVYFAESDGAQSTFLKWQEITDIFREKREHITVLKVQCPYGAYYFPDVADAYEEITKTKNAYPARDGAENEG